LVCNDFKVAGVVEKRGYGIAGGYFTDVNKLPPGAYLSYGHKNMAAMNCGLMYIGKCNCNDMPAAAITGAMR
jgi:hypothetical protein